MTSGVAALFLHMYAQKGKGGTRMRKEFLEAGRVVGTHGDAKANCAWNPGATAPPF